MLQRVVSDLSTFVDGRDIPEDTLDSFIVSLEFVYRELIVLETTSQLTPAQHEASDIVRHCLSSFRSRRQLNGVHENEWLSQVHVIHTGLVGRPYFEISYDQLT